MSTRKIRYLKSKIREAQAEIRRAFVGNEEPFDNASALDRLRELSKLDPSEGMYFVQKLLNSSDPDTIYTGIGLWDHVLTTGSDEWQQNFRRLSNKIPKAAERVDAVDQTY